MASDKKTPHNKTHKPTISTSPVLKQEDNVTPITAATPVTANIRDKAPITSTTAKPKAATTHNTKAVKKPKTKATVTRKKVTPAKPTTIKKTTAKAAQSTSKATSKKAAIHKNTSAKSPSTKAKGKTMTTTQKKTSRTAKTKTTASNDSILQFSREGAEKFAKTTDAASKAFNDAVTQSKDSIQACVESGNITTDMTKSFFSEGFRFANESFSDNVEISKDAFNCRTMNDVLDIQTKMIRSNMDHFFNQSTRMSEIVFQFMADAVEPLNESATRATDRLAKIKL